MHETILEVTLAVLAVRIANAIAPRVRLAAPILLVVFGIIASAIPQFGNLEFEPELVLAVLLPPLLFAASASMPTMDFRREFLPVGALAIFLVVITAVVLGFFLSWIIPDIEIWWGIALGAVLSPTDAAAVAIAKKAHLSGRLVSILEGESLLNDATALVLLRTATAAAVVSFSVWESIWDFASAAVLATIIGFIVGQVILHVRAGIRNPAVSTVWSFVAPFLAAVPSEQLGASGLVAAVVAGLVAGNGAVKYLNADQRVSDKQTWKAIEVVLEGLIFLVMGLQLRAIVSHVRHDHDSIRIAAVTAVLALAITLLVRALFLIPLLGFLDRYIQRGQQIKERYTQFRENLATDALQERRCEERLSAQGFARQRNRFVRFFADIDYYLSQPLGKNAGVILVWGGMRGAITLAAAQTLPTDAPHRSLLILIAFLVAAISLAVQGLTLPRVVAKYAPVSDPQRIQEQRDQVIREILVAGLPQEQREDFIAQMTLPRPSQADLDRREQAQYKRLLELRDSGEYDSEVLSATLAALDAQQIARRARAWGDE
ncbi:MAG: cation:proton antiporter [Thermomicrobiales bacterium]|nr:cation:proton antiporter [Thermomicrobiales bacterium]